MRWHQMATRARGPTPGCSARVLTLPSCGQIPRSPCDACAGIANNADAQLELPDPVALGRLRKGDSASSSVKWVRHSARRVRPIRNTDSHLTSVSQRSTSEIDRTQRAVGTSGDIPVGPVFTKLLTKGCSCTEHPVFPAPPRVGRSPHHAVPALRRQDGRPVPRPSRRGCCQLTLAPDHLCLDRLWHRRHGSVTSPVHYLLYFKKNTKKPQFHWLLSVLLITSSLNAAGST